MLLYTIFYRSENTIGVGQERNVFLCAEINQKVRLNRIDGGRRVEMYEDRVKEYLCEALEAEDPAEKDYYLRQTLQLLAGEQIGPSVR